MKEIKKIYLIDDTNIIEYHDQIISNDEILFDHMHVINNSIEFINWIVRIQNDTHEETLTLLRLSIRCFNSSGAAILLTRAGYWQQAYTIIRDIYETTFLLDLLNSDRKKLSEWMTASEPERKRKFSPLEVRKSLDKRDGFTEKKRAKRYNILSIYGTHPNPEGIKIISPNGKTKIGPFEDKIRLNITCEELAIVTTQAALIIAKFTTIFTHDDTLRKITFLDQISSWYNKYRSKNTKIEK